VIDFVDKFDS